MTKIYLAARYGRRAELVDYAADLQSRGFTIVSRWLRGQDAELDAAPPPGAAARWAMADYQDIIQADWCISFTEDGTDPGAARGGRHVEFGIALAMDQRLIIIGPREHAFHHLPGVVAYPDWLAFMEALDATIFVDVAGWSAIAAKAAR